MVYRFLNKHAQLWVKLSIVKKFINYKPTIVYNFLYLTNSSHTTNLSTTPTTKFTIILGLSSISLKNFFLYKYLLFKLFGYFNWVKKIPYYGITFNIFNQKPYPHYLGNNSEFYVRTDSFFSKNKVSMLPKYCLFNQIGGQSGS